MVRPDTSDILGDAELVSIIGAINVEWDEIELGLWYVFDTLLNARWDYSYTIFYSQQNHRARRDMVEALASVALGDNEAKLKTVQTLLGRIKRAASKRNQITHGLWTEVNTGSVMELRRMPIRRDHRQRSAYSKADLKRLRDQLVNLREDLDAFAYDPWRKKNHKYVTP